MDEEHNEETLAPTRHAKRRGCIIPPSAVIVASGFLINTIYGGLSYIPGLYLNSLLETYKAGKSLTAWAISIQVSITYFSGIIAGPLIDRFGTRIVGVAGSLLSTCGYLLSAFSPNIEFLYLTFGLMTGVGFGFLMLSNGLAVQQHTSARRALAAGTTLIGSGLGAFIMPLVTKWAILLYGWRGSMVFLSGLLLNTLPCALLLHPPPPLPPLPDFNLTHLPPEDEFPHPLTEEGAKSPPTNSKMNGNGEIKTSLTNSSVKLHKDGENKTSLIKMNKDQESKTSLSNSIVKLYKDNLGKSRMTMCSSTMTVGGSLRQRISAGSTLSLPVVYTSNLSIHKLNYLSALHLNTADSPPKPDLTTCWSRFKMFFKPTLEDDEPLLTPVTLLGITSWFFYFAGMPVLYVFMAVKAASLGFEITAGATLMSLTGIGEVSGRLAGALIGTLHETLPLILYSSSVMLSGLCTASIVLCTTYAHMVTASIGYGFTVGMSASMSTTALRDLVGINRLPWMVGMAFTFGGFGNLLSIQALAYAWEQTGSFFIPYLLGGAFLVICGLNMFGAKFIKKVKHEEQVTEHEIETFVS